jgi:hypothetical protein
LNKSSKKFLTHCFVFAVARAQQIGKSFLVLFFKKELLPSLDPQPYHPPQFVAATSSGRALERLQPVWKIVDIRPAAQACCL